MPVKPYGQWFSDYSYKYYQKIIKGNVVVSIKHFFATMILPKQQKATFVTLIPKQINMKLPKDYWPISLCNFFYKLIAKILIIQLKKFLPKLIFEEERAFVSRRCILNTILLVQKILHSMTYLACGGKLMGLKMDKERTYDYISWRFVELVLSIFGFNHQFIAWVMSCIQNSSFTL